MCTFLCGGGEVLAVRYSCYIHMHSHSFFVLHNGLTLDIRHSARKGNHPNIPFLMANLSGRIIFDKQSTHHLFFARPSQSRIYIYSCRQKCFLYYANPVGVRSISTSSAARGRYLVTKIRQCLLEHSNNGET